MSTKPAPRRVPPPPDPPKLVAKPRDLPPRATAAQKRAYKLAMKPWNKYLKDRDAMLQWRRKSGITVEEYHFQERLRKVREQKALEQKQQLEREKLNPPPAPQPPPQTQAPVQTMPQAYSRALEVGPAPATGPLAIPSEDEEMAAIRLARHLAQQKLIAKRERDKLVPPRGDTWSVEEEFNREFDR